MKFAFFLTLLGTVMSSYAQSPTSDILFSGDDRIYVVHANGTEQIAITPPAIGTSHPRWSRNANQIVFTKGNLTYLNSSIWKMNADGSDQTFVIDESNIFYIPTEPVFSPNADRIAFIGCECLDPGDTVDIVDADGHNFRIVTNRLFGLHTAGLDWSPTGERLVFSESSFTEQYGYFGQIDIVNTDRTGKAFLTDGSQGNNFDPRWSPDGSKIAFVSDRDGNDEVYIMNSDGSDQLRITKSAADDRNPTWSPEGTKLAFSSNRNGPYNIFVMNADGSDPIQITHNAFDSRFPDWNPVSATRRISDYDFDGDGKTDLGVVRDTGFSLRQWWIRNSSNGATTAAEFGSEWTDIPAPADFTGDGKTDIATFGWSDGNWRILRSEDATLDSVKFGTNDDIPVPADYDGDNKDDIAIFRPSSGTWWILGSSTGLQVSQFGAAGDKPVPADYDGDGKADIAVYRLNNGAEEWWLQRSSAGLFATVFGVAGDKAVPGDYTGDGKTDIAIWRPSNGNWFVLRSEDLSFFAFPWGANGDIPAPGDYDGDGKFDAAVFRQSGATWFINRTGGSGPLITSFGAATDSPIAGTYVR